MTAEIGPVQAPDIARVAICRFMQIADGASTGRKTHQAGIINIISEIGVAAARFEYP